MPRYTSGSGSGRLAGLVPLKHDMQLRSYLRPRHTRAAATLARVPSLAVLTEDPCFSGTPGLPV
jgi:hypothetical protein